MTEEKPKSRSMITWVPKLMLWGSVAAFGYLYWESIQEQKDQPTEVAATEAHEPAQKPTSTRPAVSPMPQSPVKKADQPLEQATSTAFADSLMAKPQATAPTAAAEPAPVPRAPVAAAPIPQPSAAPALATPPQMAQTSTAADQAPTQSMQAAQAAFMAQQAQIMAQYQAMQRAAQERMQAYWERMQTAAPNGATPYGYPPAPYSYYPPRGYAPAPTTAQ